jgi:hypothetical protein
MHHSYLVCKSQATEFAVSCPCNHKRKKNQDRENDADNLCPFSVRASKKRAQKESESSKWKITKLTSSKWKVTKLTLDHTCNSQGDRKHNYRSADLENAFQVLSQLLKATNDAATASQTRGQDIAASSQLSMVALRTTTGRPINLHKRGKW